MAILARESFWEIERRRLCDEDFMIGEAAEVVECSYGSELRNEGVSGDRGVRGGKGLDCEVVDEMKRDDRGCMLGRCAATLAGRVDFSDTAGELLRVEPPVNEEDSEMRNELPL